MCYVAAWVAVNLYPIVHDKWEPGEIGRSHQKDRPSWSKSPILVLVPTMLMACVGV